MQIYEEIARYRPTPTFLADRVIVVTGAGQGLGRAIALAAAKHGATVALLGRSSKKLEATFDAIVASGAPEPAIAPLDFANASDQDFSQLAQMIGHELGRCDGIIHCAAMLKHLQPLAHEPLDDWLSMLRVNLAAPFALTRACLPLLQQSDDASIVFVSESHGLRPAAYWGGFAVSKFALSGLMQVWNDELTSENSLRLNIVIPGPMQSPQRALTHPGEDKSLLKRPEDLTAAFLYLLSVDSKKVRGHTLELQAAR
jgi:NAD(P)-dependent dehydrogenase (short-subunit alcohol dehydrogenase family)